MDSKKLERVVAQAGTLTEALDRSINLLGPDSIDMLFYGYFVSYAHRNRNDCVIANSGDSDWSDAFRRMGGTVNDIVASKLEDISGPFSFDLESTYAAMKTVGDTRANYVALFVEKGLRTAWICPVQRAGVMGTVVLNSFYRARGAKPYKSPEAMTEVAMLFHKTARDTGLIAKDFGITKKQQKVLKMLTEGKSIDDISSINTVARASVDQMLSRIKDSLNAKTKEEAIYKAAAYGII